jgi:hypothetical protein
VRQTERDPPLQASAPTSARSKTASRRRARARHRAAHHMAPRRSKSRGRPQRPGLRFDSSSPAPAGTLLRQAAVEQADLTFSVRESWGVGRWRPMRACAARSRRALIRVRATAGSWSFRSVSGSVLCRFKLPGSRLGFAAVWRRSGYFLRPVRRFSRSTTVLPGRRFSVPFLRKRPVIVSRTRLPLPAPRRLAIG